MAKYVKLNKNKRKAESLQWRKRLEIRENESENIEEWMHAIFFFPRSGALPLSAHLVPEMRESTRTPLRRREATDPVPITITNTTIRVLYLYNSLATYGKKQRS